MAVGRNQNFFGVVVPKRNLQMRAQHLHFLALVWGMPLHARSFSPATFRKNIPRVYLCTWGRKQYSYIYILL